MLGHLLRRAGVDVVIISDVELHGIDSESPPVTFMSGDLPRRLDARFMVGCDGYHGPSRRPLPDDDDFDRERVYPFGWLGILADVPPCHYVGLPL